MSTSQWMSLIQSILLILSGVLIQKGYLTQTQFNNLENQITTAMPTLLAAIAAIVPIATTIWGLIAHSMKSKIKDVASSSAVEKIVVKRDAPHDDPAVQVAVDPSIPKVSLAEKKA